MQELGEAPAPVSTEDLIKQLGEGPLKELLSQAIDGAAESERQTQIRKAHYNWRMVKGDQFLAPGFITGPSGSEIIDYISVDSLPSEDETGAGVVFAYPINVLGGDCWKFVAVMGQSAPNVKAVPDDIEDDQSIAAAKDADACIRDLWAQWRADDLQRVLAFHQYTTGPVFGHTCFTTDEVKYGSTAEPKFRIEEQEQPDGSIIPVPVEDGAENYPNGDVELDLGTVLDWTIPFSAKRVEDCYFAVKERAVNKWKLLSTYPEKLGKYRESEPEDDEGVAASSTLAAEAADAVRNPTGIGRATKPSEWRFTQVWLQPFMYWAFKPELREALKQQFPDGVRIDKVRGVIVDLVHENFCHVVSVCKTGRGERILDDPLCSDGVPIQRALNDLFNLAVETVLRAITQVVVDQMLLDRQTMSTKEALPYEMIFTQQPMGQDITKMIAEIPPARVSDQLRPLIDTLRAYGQDISGIRPELSGGGVPTQTFREAKQRKDQALMQLSPQAKEQQAFWEKVAENGVRQRARHGVGIIRTQKKTGFGIESSVVDMAALQEQGWHAEADDGIPMSFTERHDALYSLLKEYPPEVQQALALLDPANLEKTLELLQLPDFESPLENQKRKTLEDIRELLKDGPIEGDPGPDGKPALLPSVPIDDYDNHGFVADFLGKWQVSAAGRKAKLENRRGFDNVDAFRKAHQQAAQPEQPTPPPVKANMNVSVKAETLPPDALNEIFTGAGLPPLPPPAPGPEAPPPEIGTPEQPDAPPESPLPPPPPEGAEVPV